MKNLTILKLTATLTLMFLGYANSWGQNEVGMPGGLFLHGNNSSNATTIAENTDSVTVGAVMQYWAEPDAAVANASNTYAWTLSSVALGSQTAGTPTNLATITFGAAPTIGTIQVIETSSNGCAGSAQIIDVQSIAAPDVTGNSFSAVACPTGTNGSYAVAGPTATLTIDSKVSGNKQVNIHYTLDGPVGFADIANTALSLGNGNTINLSSVTLTHAGTYTLTIVDIADRISTKSGIVPATINRTYTFVLNPAPVTGPIYHVPNM